MLDQLKKATPFVLGGIAFLIVYLVPEAKPIACGLAFAAPLLGGGT